ncbi:MAG: flagellar hook-associated protein FlgK [Spirochaetales bacterium]|nr:flagellar hook-associated protein FlgK [Spirochaetales bacterium]MCF7937573.1 flagellar hook-associated protein FlgK [Spirochaetales bacterium]
MQSTFAGIEIGKRSILAHTQGLHTVGHNLSNASVEGYSRQQVRMKPSDPIYDPAMNREMTPGQIGQGVDVSSIERVRDMILEGRIISRANGEGYWETRDNYILMMEQVYNEPGESSVRSLMDKFWNSWQELSLRPSESAARRTVLQRGQSLIDGIHNRYQSLKQIRDMLEDDVQATVRQVNDLTNRIASLNQQIVKVEALGDNPNDLLDQRDRLSEELSKIIDISIDDRDPDEYTIHTGGMHLVQGRISRNFALEAGAENDGYSRVVWEHDGTDATFRGGRLAALVELRDVDVRDEIQKLDMMTMNMVDLVNEVHRAGTGKNGERNVNFFEEYPFIGNIAGNYDRSGDGEYDSSYIFRITGVNELEAQQQIGLEGTITLPGPDQQIEVDYYSTDTVEDLIQRVNTSGAEVVARLDRSGRLEVKATPAADSENPDFVIRSLQDSGSFLTGYAGMLTESGAEGAYNWETEDAVLSLRGGGLDYAVAPLAHPSGWIEVNRDLLQDPGAIAAGLGENGRPAEPGDNTAALEIASIRNSEVMIGRTTTFDNYFADTVSDVALKGEEAERAMDTEQLVMKDLRDMRESLSGVNIDEEMAQMIKFQHGYTAAARFITEYTRMLDTIINRMGV